MGHDLADMLFHMSGELFSTDPHNEMNAHKVVNSPDFNVFASNLFHEVDQQRLQAIGTIYKLRQNMNNSLTFGEALVKRLQRETGSIYQDL